MKLHIDVILDLRNSRHVIITPVMYDILIACTLNCIVDA